MFYVAVNMQFIYVYNELQSYIEIIDFKLVIIANIMQK